MLRFVRGEGLRGEHLNGPARWGIEVGWGCGIVFDSVVDGGDAGACGVRERERLTTEVAEGPQRERGEWLLSSTSVADWLGQLTIPPLRGPTRHKTARKRKSGRSGRDDRFSS